ncbi:acetylglutamate/acetylaminoadipate kinase [Halanaeroarchaeum sulfurireducens]|uniref:Putative [LysW]-aminoadipate/[LysW]-glutamate kinase n=1 Tax=Halanaeroarchaeum sulfurireducens TaxID=1604004 RepID=A0A0F7PEF8_9EURY|nr:acetylglutamate/acetylaminoadipate kinase [Halanaeroarchaeum sulfurireducens]AKH98600.1 acetylglutamate kinase [Halanaeroarchaeum sulfurireducens]
MIVVKIGGARAVDPQGAIDDVATLVGEGEAVVVVHGGSTAVDDALEAVGTEPEYVETPDGVTGRFTDAETMDVFTMAMGKVNTDLVTDLQNAGISAVGLNGVDGGLLTGRRKSAVKVREDGKTKIRRGDHSGTITDVNEDLLETLLDAGYTPVVSVPMLAEDGVAVNTDADRAAAAVAGATGASLVVLTDVAGVYEDPADPTTRIESVDSPAALDRTKAAAEGFMTKKVLAATEALEGGAAEVVVAEATAETPIVSALEGDATRFEPDAIA